MALFQVSKRNELCFLPLFLPLSFAKGGKVFNSLKHVKKLEEAGIPREQAETHIQIVTEIMETSLATKEDVKELQMAVKQTFQELRQEMKYDLSLIDQKIIQSEQRMTIKLGTIVSLAIGVAVVLAKIMI